MNRRLFTFAVLSSFMLFGCDNTATVSAPEGEAASEKVTASNYDQISIVYSD